MMSERTHIVYVWFLTTKYHGDGTGLIYKLKNYLDSKNSRLKSLDSMKNDLW